MFGQQIRDRISKDIHDDIGAGLTKISVMGELLKSKFKSNDRERITEMIDNMILSSVQTADKLGEIVWSSDPKNDNLEAFLIYLRNYIFHFFEDTSLDVTIDFSEPKDNIPLNAEFIRNLFLIIKEALNNVVKYSFATNVKVELKIQSKKYTLIISDNGVGFNQNETNEHQKSNGGNGISNMKKRAEKINANFHLETAEKNGVIITINGILYQ